MLARLFVALQVSSVHSSFCVWFFLNRFRRAEDIMRPSSSKSLTIRCTFLLLLSNASLFFLILLSAVVADSHATPPSAELSTVSRTDRSVVLLVKNPEVILTWCKASECDDRGSDTLTMCEVINAATATSSDVWPKDVEEKIIKRTPVANTESTSSDWLRDGVLISDLEPSTQYMARCEFTAGGTSTWSKVLVFTTLQEGVCRGVSCPREGSH